MNIRQQQLAKKYVDLFLRRKGLILAFLLLSLPVGLGVYLVTPKVYQASSLLSYQQQKISPNKMSPDVESRIRDIVSTLTQIVTSRTSLEEIITGFDLYPEMRRKFPMEDVVANMRQRIKIEPSAQGDIFKIVFNHSSPAQVVRVTNALAAKFIEENLKYREERASETSSYTSDELRMAKRMMDDKESAMRDYKVKHYNEMPEQRAINVSRLIALQKQYQDKQDSIQDLERTLVLIQDQISNRKKVQAQEQELALGEELAPSSTPLDRNEPLSSRQRLVQMERYLDQLKMKYTDAHPEVRRAKKLIARLQDDVSSSGDDEEVMQHDTVGRAAGDVISVDKIILQLETQHKNVQLNIGSIKQEMEDLKQTIAEYEQWVSAAPVREAEWSALTREYGQLKRHYEYLVAQDLEAKSMLNLERKQKGSQFKIEDPARLPEKPIKPNFLLIMTAALLGGACLAVGGVLLVDFFDTSFRDPTLIEEGLGLPLLSTIPLVEIKKEKKFRRWRSILSAVVFSAAIIIIIGLFAVVWKKGLIVV